MQSFYRSILCDNIYYKEQAGQAFKKHVEAFTLAYKSLYGEIDNTKWVTKREKELPVLKEIDYKFYRKKK